MDMGMDMNVSTEVHLLSPELRLVLLKLAYHLPDLEYHENMVSSFLAATPAWDTNFPHLVGCRFDANYPIHI